METPKSDLWLTKVKAYQFLELAKLYGRQQAAIDLMLADAVSESASEARVERRGRSQS
jgi:hypothetical protein